jgi:hypothetical protein
MFNRNLIVGVLASLMMVTYVPAQTAPQPLTNDDVVSLAKEGLPESTIISAIQSQNNNFDLSANGLIGLKKHGVSSGMIDAMLAASKAPAAPVAAAPAQAAPAVAGEPSVTISDGGANNPLPLSKTQISQTKTKSASLTGLASDAALVSAFQGIALQAGASALYRNGSVIGGGMLGSAGGMMSGFLARRKPTVTEVWAIAGQKAETVASNNPSFEVHFANIPGVNADEYEPVLIKLAPSAKNFRLVGATEAKQDVFESQALDWQVYSSFVEDRVAAQAKKSGLGRYELAPNAPLASGEYGIALRPLNKGKKFSASSVQQNSGDGMLFNSVWAFSVN